MPTFHFPIGSVIRCNVYCTIAGQTSVGTHKYQMTSITGSSTFSSAALLAELDSIFSTNMPPLLSNNANYYGIQLYLDNPIGPAPRPDSSNLLAGPGTGGAGLLPSQAAGLISWYTATLGKSGQGRTYVPFPPPDANDADGTPTAAYITALDTLAFSIRAPKVIVDAGITGTFEHVLYAGGIATPVLVIDSTQRNAWATQRRRGAYGRANANPF